MAAANAKKHKSKNRVTIFQGLKDKKLFPQLGLSFANLDQCTY